MYAGARLQASGRVLITKGTDHGAAIVGMPSAVDVNYAGKKIARGVKVWPINVSALKSELYGWLRLDWEADESGDKSYPPGYCHFPKMSEEFFRQLTAEQLIARLVKGFRRTEWVKCRERNEALDTRIYARAAASQFGTDRFQELQWLQLEAQVLDRVTAPVKSEPEDTTVAAPVIQLQQRTGQWLGERRRNWLR